MREFSKELIPKDDRTFEIGGEMFRWRYPFWQEYAERREADTQAVKAAQQNGDSEEEFTFVDLYQDYFNRIETFIDPENDGIARWKRLAKRKSDPVPAYQLPELYFWLLEVTSGRPTGQPSPSESGPGQTVSSSTEGSS
jgi:hypothetical protein